MSSLSRKSLLLFLAVILTMLIGFVAAENAYADDIDVYVTVERTLIKNQDPILEPYRITVSDDSTVVDILDAIKEELKVGNDYPFNYTLTGSVANNTAYVKGFKVTGHPNTFNHLYDYEFDDDFDDACYGDGDIFWDSFACNNPPLSSTMLQHGDYNFWGGWIVSANNEIVWDDESTENIDEAYPTAYKPVAQDDTVLRFEYSCALARDCGYDGWSLLTGNDPDDAFYTASDKSALIRAMANCTNKNSAAYTNGLVVLKNMTVSQATVNAAVNQF